MELLLPLVIATGFGVWTYTDAKALDQRGIRVLKWSPAAWGWLVFLFALVFGILYLVNRPKAISGNTAARPEPETEPDVPRRFCVACGTTIVPHAAYCHACGRPVEHVSP
jgi:hypothetical protein